jgi:hypothetical protein
LVTVEFWCWYTPSNLKAMLAMVGRSMCTSALRRQIAHAARNAPAEFAGGGLGHDAQRAAFGVAAKQRALRAAQHFHALHIEQGGVQALRRPR